MAYVAGNDYGGLRQYFVFLQRTRYASGNTISTNYSCSIYDPIIPATNNPAVTIPTNPDIATLAALQALLLTDSDNFSTGPLDNASAQEWLNIGRIEANPSIVEAVGEEDQLEKIMKLISETITGTIVDKEVSKSNIDWVKEFFHAQQCNMLLFDCDAEVGATLDVPYCLDLTTYIEKDMGTEGRNRARYTLSRTTQRASKLNKIQTVTVP